MIYKKLLRKLTIEQHVPHYKNQGWQSSSKLERIDDFDVRVFGFLTPKYLFCYLALKVLDEGSCALSLISTFSLTVT
jgi:hypothetical protein